MKNRKDSKEGINNIYKKVDSDSNSDSFVEEEYSCEKEINDYKNTVPCNCNLLDNYDILQYKDIKMPKLKLINAFNLNKYKKPFNEVFQKIKYDYALTQYFFDKFFRYSNIEFKKMNTSENFAFFEDSKSPIINHGIFVLSELENRDIITYINDNQNDKNYKIEKINEKFLLGKFKSIRKLFKLKKYDKNKILIHKKRGRVALKKKTRHIHSALDDDNVLRKIQVHFYTFLVSFTNDYIDSLSNNIDKKDVFHFKQIDYQIKKTINHTSIEKMKSSNIGEILQQQVSPKNKTCQKNINEIIFRNLCQQFPEIKQNYFNKLFKEFFIEYYYNKSDNTSINGIKINLSNKTKNFNKLIQKNINHSNRFRNVAAYFYLDKQVEKDYKKEEKRNREGKNNIEKPFFIID